MKAILWDWQWTAWSWINNELNLTFLTWISHSHWEQTIRSSLSWALSAVWSFGGKGTVNALGFWESPDITNLYFLIFEALNTIYFLSFLTSSSSICLTAISLSCSDFSSWISLSLIFESKSSLWCFLIIEWSLNSFTNAEGAFVGEDLSGLIATWKSKGLNSLALNLDSSWICFYSSSICESSFALLSSPRLRVDS